MIVDSDESLVNMSAAPLIGARHTRCALSWRMFADQGEKHNLTPTTGAAADSTNCGLSSGNGDTKGGLSFLARGQLSVTQIAHSSLLHDSAR